MQAKPKLTEAHDRAANAWRQALRHRDRPELFREPDDAERKLLLSLYDAGASGSEGIALPIGDPNRHRHLVAAGLAEYGVRLVQIVWASSGEISRQEDVARRLRLTERGRRAIDDLIDARHAEEDARSRATLAAGVGAQLEADF